MLRGPLAGLALACVLGALGAAMLAAGGHQPSPAKTPQAQQRPTFRSDVNFVRLDVFARLKGLPVPDLAQEDFEVLEDGVVQKVAAFEHILIRPGADSAERVDPRNVRESIQMAGDARNRLFVLFLDTYNVTDPAAYHGSIRMPGSATQRLPAQERMGPPTFVDQALSNFLQRTIGPDDLIAVMTPEMNAAEVTFVRRPDSIREYLATAWAQRSSLDNLDPGLERYYSCYPPDDPLNLFEGVAEEMVLRERGGRVMSSLRDLVRRLGQIREERKGVLVISEGWELFRTNPTLARQFKGVPPPQLPGVYVGSGGKLTTGADPRSSWGVDWQACETARVRLANLDLQREFREVTDEANRANASFYPVDPRGLAARDAPAGAVSGQNVIADQARLRERLETLRTAASATDGLAVLNSNDLGSSLKRVVDDLSDYYLLGYYSTNARADGTFRTITVKVKKPGVEVRTRRGYQAATAEEVAARARASAPSDPGAESRRAALASLDRMRADRVAFLSGGFGWESPPGGAAGAAPRPVFWIAGELASATAREPEWRTGGTVSIVMMNADGATLATDQATVSQESRAFVRFLSSPDLTAGDYVVRVRMQNSAGGAASFTEQLRLTVPARAAAGVPQPGQPLMYRRGPFTGPAFQPTADNRFRRAERLRIDVPVADGGATIAARLLDRKGQPLPIPMPVSLRDDAGRQFATAEVAFAPLTQGDYLVEFSLQRGQQTATVLVPIRIVQ